VSLKAIVSLSFAAIALTLGLLAWVLLPSSASPEPERPANVPASAQWAGGPDGGMWIQCDPTGGYLSCRVYANVTGVLVEEGEFFLSPGSVRPTRYSAGFIGADVRFERGKGN